MSFEPLNLTPIKQQLADMVSELQQIGGAADYAAVGDLNSFFTPSAFVVLADEKDLTHATEQPGRRPSGRQQLRSTFGVILALQNFRDPQGEAVSDDARTLIGKSRAALMGWTPDQSLFGRIWFQTGNVLDYSDNMLLWLDVYNTTHFIGGTA